MKTRLAAILLGTVLAAGMASPSWAQGSEEHSDNGGGHPGVAIGPYWGARPHINRHARISEPRRQRRELRTTGQGASREQQKNNTPNGESADNAGNE